MDKLTKMVDGKVIECTPDEVTAIEAEWKQNDELSAKNADYNKETQSLILKYPDLLRAIDLIYQKLGL
jgi:hypothetical protein